MKKNSIYKIRFTLRLKNIILRRRQAEEKKGQIFFLFGSLFPCFNFEHDTNRWFQRILRNLSRAFRPYRISPMVSKKYWSLYNIVEEKHSTGFQIFRTFPLWNLYVEELAMFRGSIAIRMSNIFTNLIRFTFYAL